MGAFGAPALQSRRIVPEGTPLDFLCGFVFGFVFGAFFVILAFLMCRINRQIKKGLLLGLIAKFFYAVAYVSDM